MATGKVHVCVVVFSIGVILHQWDLGAQQRLFCLCQHFSQIEVMPPCAALCGTLPTSFEVSQCFLGTDCVV